jgi:hypothetical protein
MTAGAGSRSLAVRRGAFWIAGAGIGIAGGFATLVVAPVAIVLELIVVLVLAAARPRPFGLAGALVGHGLVWSWLFATDSFACVLDSLRGQCTDSLPFGPAHYVTSTWQTEMRLWSLGALLLVLAGLTLTVAAARRVRTRRELAA